MGAARARTTSAQWAALRFFSRANRSSRTVSSFADYHRTTRGTASQTVKSLVERGMLQRTRQQTDGRVVQIDLTPEGARLSEKDPFEDIARVIGGLPQADQATLTTILMSLSDQIAEDRQSRSFGPCSKCRYLRKSMGLEDKETVYFCRFMSEPLPLSELDMTCMDYKAGVNRV
ncbi:MAG: MarR family transcriptional regulator [Hyphomicrobiales bacterium]|nr:MarR family transcriptional regulator [Hyphomicrobiales bacterium]